MTFYLGVVDRADDGSLGVWFPDLPGCTSAGRDMDDLFEKSIDAIRLWAEDALAEDGHLPVSRESEALMADAAVRDALEAARPWGCLLQVPQLLDEGRNVRANISIDAGLLQTIDQVAKRSGLTRSAFLASAAQDKIRRGA